MGLRACLCPPRCACIASAASPGGWWSASTDPDGGAAGRPAAAGAGRTRSGERVGFLDGGASTGTGRTPRSGGAARMQHGAAHPAACTASTAPPACAAQRAGRVAARVNSIAACTSSAPRTVKWPMTSSREGMHARPGAAGSRAAPHPRGAAGLRDGRSSSRARRPACARDRPPEHGSPQDPLPDDVTPAARGSAEADISASCTATSADPPPPCEPLSRRIVHRSALRRSSSRACPR